MKTFPMIAAAALLLAGAAHAESLGEKTGVNSALGVSPSTQDFVTQAAVGGMFEIQSSQLALERGDEQTKMFAQTMITDHQKLAEQLKSFVDSSGGKLMLPTALDEDHKEMVDELAKLSGPGLLDEYHDDQEDAHEDAVSLFERYADGGDDPALKRWASEALPILEHHLQMAEKLDDDRT